MFVLKFWILIIFVTKTKKLIAKCVFSQSICCYDQVVGRPHDEEDDMSPEHTDDVEREGLSPSKRDRVWRTIILQNLFFLQKKISCHWMRFIKLFWKKSNVATASFIMFSMRFSVAFQPRWRFTRRVFFSLNSCCVVVHSALIRYVFLNIRDGLMFFHSWSVRSRWKYIFEIVLNVFVVMKCRVCSEIILSRRVCDEKLCWNDFWNKYVTAKNNTERIRKKNLDGSWNMILRVVSSIESS